MQPRLECIYCKGENSYRNKPDELWNTTLASSYIKYILIWLLLHILEAKLCCGICHN